MVLPMDDTFLDEGKKSITDLSQQLDCLFLNKNSSRFSLKVMLKVCIAKLLYDVIVIGAFHDIIKSNNILWVDGLHNFDLRDQCCLQVGIWIDYDGKLITARLV